MYREIGPYRLTALDEEDSQMAAWTGHLLEGLGAPRACLLACAQVTWQTPKLPMLGDTVLPA